MELDDIERMMPGQSFVAFAFRNVGEDDGLVELAPTTASCPRYRRLIG